MCMLYVEAASSRTVNSCLVHLEAPSKKLQTQKFVITQLEMLDTMYYIFRGGPRCIITCQNMEHTPQQIYLYSLKGTFHA